MKRETKAKDKEGERRDVTPLKSRIEQLRAAARGARRQEASWSRYAQRVESTLARCEEQLATPACFVNSMEVDDHVEVER